MPHTITAAASNQGKQCSQRQVLTCGLIPASHDHRYACIDEGLAGVIKHLCGRATERHQHDCRRLRIRMHPFQRAYYVQHRAGPVAVDHPHCAQHTYYMCLAFLLVCEWNAQRFSRGREHSSVVGCSDIKSFCLQLILVVRRSVLPRMLSLSSSPCRCPQLAYNNFAYCMIVSVVSSACTHHPILPQACMQRRSALESRRRTGMDEGVFGDTKVAASSGAGDVCAVAVAVRQGSCTVQREPSQYPRDCPISAQKLLMCSVDSLHACTS